MNNEKSEKVKTGDKLGLVGRLLWLLISGLCLVFAAIFGFEKLGRALTIDRDLFLLAGLFLMGAAAGAWVLQKVWEKQEQHSAE